MPPGADERAERVVSAIPRRRQLAYAALLLAVALLIVELSMRVVFWWKGDLPPTPDDSLVYEWEWAQRHLAVGSGEIPPDSSFRFDPDLGWALLPNWDAEGVTTNSRGMRATREHAPGRRPGQRRLALLGDSFAFGAYVADDETIAHFLEAEALPGWEALNFAVSGYGTDQALLAYELRGADLAADVVVMGFYVRDYERNLLRFKVYAKPRFEPDGDGLRLTHHPVIAPEALYQEYASGRRVVGRTGTPYLALSIAKSLRRLRERWPSESDPEWRVLSRLMRRFRDHVLAQGAVPVWLVIPYHDVMETDRSRYAAIEELCEREAAALDLPVLRVETAFREHAARQPDVRLYRPRRSGGHLSVAGNRLVAASLAARLRDGGRVPGLGSR